MLRSALRFLLNMSIHFNLPPAAGIYVSGDMTADCDYHGLPIEPYFHDMACGNRFMCMPSNGVYVKMKPSEEAKYGYNIIQIVHTQTRSMLDTAIYDLNIRAYGTFGDIVSMTATDRALGNEVVIVYKEDKIFSITYSDPNHPFGEYRVDDDAPYPDSLVYDPRVLHCKDPKC